MDNTWHLQVRPWQFAANTLELFAVEQIQVIFPSEMEDAEILNPSYILLVARLKTMILESRKVLGRYMIRSYREQNANSLELNILL